MTFYYQEQTKRTKGRPITTLPVTLDNDLKRLNDKSLRLTSYTQLENIKTIAQNRDEWTAFTTLIHKTAEAAKSDDLDGERQ